MRLLWISAVLATTMNLTLSEDPKVLLVKARQQEHVTQAPEDAAALYEQVAQDTNAPEAARTEAFEGLARCLLKLGRDEEARRLAARSPPPA